MRIDRFLQAEREVSADVAAAVEAEDKAVVLQALHKMEIRGIRKKIPEIRVALQKKTIQRKKNKRRARQ